MEDDANDGEAEFMKPEEDTLETRPDVGSLIGDECKQDEGRYYVGVKKFVSVTYWTKTGMFYLIAL